MSNPTGYQEIYMVTLEQLKKIPEGQYEVLLGAVADAAQRTLGVRATGIYGTREYCSEYVRQALHRCYVQGILVFGSSAASPNWPFFRVTEYGRKVLAAGKPQPHDPDRFLEYFDTTCPGVDPTVRDYIAEAVHTFNSDCPRASAVMLGCASEKLILLLCDAFEAAIAESVKKAAFQKDLVKKWTISHKYKTLLDRLNLMVTSKKLPQDHKETVSSELPAGFELLRRCRNSGGHPDVPGDVSTETIFMNLRMFTEYAHRVQELIMYFGSNSADW